MNDAKVRATEGHLELPKGWLRARLSEVCEEVQKVDPESIYKREFIYVDIGSIDNDAKIISDPKSLLVSEAPSRARQLIRSGDVLFSTVRTYLKNIAAVPEQLDGQIASTGFCVLRGRPGIIGRYLYWYCLADEFVSRLTPVQRGTSYPAVRDEDVKQQFIPIPPLPGQERIVAKIDELFSELDAGVASLERARALLKKYRQAVLKAAVTGELTRDWRERHRGQIMESGADLLQRILKARREAWEAAELKKLRAKGKPPKDDRWKQKYKEPQPPDKSSLPDLPKGWVWISLDQLLTGIEAGKNFRCVERPPTGDEVGVVKVSSVTWGIFNENESKTITDLRRVDRRYTIRPGDFLFSRANTIELVGACVIAGEFRKNLLLSDKILRLSFAHDLGRWVDICVKSKLGRSQIEALATGNQLSMRNISQPSIRRLAVPLPPPEEVEAAVDAVEADQSKAKEASVAIDGEVRRGEALRQSILMAAFAGKLVLRDPNDEPASVLLERIRAERAAAPKAPRGRRRKALPGARSLDLLG